MLLSMEGCAKPYAWGSRTAIAELFGWPASGEPLAELWLGAHPAGPATVQVEGRAVGLDELLATSPDLHCVDGLPFLLKVLAADQALSLQVHPSAEQAAAGFAAEERAGVPRDAPHRRYRDPNPKSEMIVALGPFRALAGVREPETTLAVVGALGLPELDAAFKPLTADPSGEGVRETLRGLLSLDADAGRELSDAVVASSARLLGEGGALAPALAPAAARYADLARTLAQHHLGDVGIVASALLHDIDLAPGEALYLPTGQLHAYVSGIGVELMVSSDNVLRGGLTGKHIDVDELLAILDPAPARPVRPQLQGDLSSWAPRTGDFRLHRAVPAGGTLTPEVDGPAVVLATEGVVRVASEGAERELVAGQALLAPSAHGVSVTGTGTCYLASCA